jgi:dTDP-4-dehydrorhamnose reductase
MDKARIIGFGLDGLVGSRIRELLSNKFDFITLSRSSGFDITNPNTLESFKNNIYADIVLHLAAKTDVDGCEKDKELGENGDAWRVNVEGAKNIAQICLETKKKIIYISTDFVFDGQKKQGEFYLESDSPNPINWYARTKIEGENAVIQSGSDYLIVRIAYPFRAMYGPKTDFMRAIKNRLEQGMPLKAVSDHIFCPTFIDDLANAIELLIRNNVSGIYHCVGQESLSPFEAAIKIAETFELDKSLISGITREEFFAGRAPRPFNLALSNAKIEKLGVNMSGFGQALHKIKSELK